MYFIFWFVEIWQKVKSDCLTCNTVNTSPLAAYTSTLQRTRGFGLLSVLRCTVM